MKSDRAKTRNPKKRTVVLALTSSGCIMALENTFDPDPLMPPSPEKRNQAGEEALEIMVRIAVPLVLSGLAQNQTPGTIDWPR